MGRRASVGVPSDGGEEDGVGRLARGEGLGEGGHARGVDGGAAHERLGEVERDVVRAHLHEDLLRDLHDLGADAVAGEEGHVVVLGRRRAREAGAGANRGEASAGPGGGAAERRRGRGGTERHGRGESGHRERRGGNAGSRREGGAAISARRSDRRPMAVCAADLRHPVPRRVTDPEKRGRSRKKIIERPFSLVFLRVSSHSTNLATFRDEDPLRASGARLATLAAGWLEKPGNIGAPPVGPARTPRFRRARVSRRVASDRARPRESPGRARVASRRRRAASPRRRPPPPGRGSWEPSCVVYQRSSRSRTRSRAMPSLQEMTAGKARLRSTPAKTPATMDRKVAKADMLRRDMAWSSDDELTPAAVRAGLLLRFRRRDARADARGGEAPRDARVPPQGRRRRSLARASPGPPANASGAALCSAGDSRPPRPGRASIRDARAFELYLGAAERGDHPPAFARVGRRWLLGEGAPRADPAEAARWFAKGVAKGDADASLATAETLEAEGAAGMPSAPTAPPPTRAPAAPRSRWGGSTPGVWAVSPPTPRRRRGGAGRGRGRRRGAARARQAPPGRRRFIRRRFERPLSRARRGALPPRRAPGRRGRDERARAHARGRPGSERRELRRGGEASVRASGGSRIPERAQQSGVHLRERGRRGGGGEALQRRRGRGDRDAIFNLGALRERGGGAGARRAGGGEAVQARRRARPRGGARRPLARAEASVAAAEEESPSGTRDAAGGTPRTTRDESAALASLRRQLAAKEKETERLAKDLGESKAECGRLKGKKAALEIETRELEKELARARRRERAQGGERAGSVLVRARLRPRLEREVEAPMEFGRSTSLASNRSGYSTASGVSGVSGGGSSGSLGERSSGGSPSGSKGKSSSKANTTAKPSLRSTKSEGGVPNPRSKSAFGGASSAGAGKNGSSGSGGRLASVFGSLAFGKGTKGTESIAKEAEKEKSKAHNRELTAMKRTLEETTLRAELHEEMAATLSGVLRATYARNLQLEDLLRDVGVDPDDAAIERELTPIAVETVGGFDVADLENGDLAFRGRAPRSDATGTTPRGTRGAAEHAKALAAPGARGESGEGKTRSPSPLSG